MRIVYLMSPYTHDDPRVMQLRYEAAVDAIQRLITKDHLIFSPVVYCHPIAEVCDVARDFNYWRPFNEAIISISDGGIVLQLKGWIDSVGIRHELDLFRKAGKSVYHITPKELGLEEE